jgi:hypothetical protein
VHQLIAITDQEDIEGLRAVADIMEHMYAGDHDRVKWRIDALAADPRRNPVVIVTLVGWLMRAGATAGSLRQLLDDAQVLVQVFAYTEGLERVLYSLESGPRLSFDL